MASSDQQEIPNSLRRQSQQRYDRGNFSWIGGIAQKIRNALSLRSVEEAQSIERQSEIAMRERLSTYKEDNEHTAEPISLPQSVSQSLPSSSSPSSASASASASEQSDSDISVQPDSPEPEPELELDEDLDYDLDVDGIVDQIDPEADIEIEDAGDLDGFMNHNLNEAVQSYIQPTEDVQHYGNSFPEPYEPYAYGAAEYSPEPGLTDDGESVESVDVSEHEAREHNPELSSMSLWEEHGFEGYDQPDLHSDGFYDEGDEQEHEDEDEEQEHEQDVDMDVDENGIEPVGESVNENVNKIEDENVKDHVDVKDHGNVNEIEDENVKDHVDVKDHGNVNEIEDENVKDHVDVKDHGNVNEIEDENVKDHGDVKDHVRKPKPQVPSGSKSQPVERYVGFLFGPGDETETETEPKGNKENKKNNDHKEKINEGSKEVPKLDFIPDPKESTLDPQESMSDPLKPRSKPSPVDFKSWNLFNVGFTVAPAEEPHPLVTTSSSSLPSPPPTEPVDFDEEFSILAQTAHRLISSSSLFGGTPRASKPKHKEDDSPPVAPIDPNTEIKNVAGTAYNLFAESPLFSGRKRSRQEADEEGSTENEKPDNINTSSKRVKAAPSTKKFSTKNSPATNPSTTNPSSANSSSANSSSANSPSSPISASTSRCASPTNETSINNSNAPQPVVDAKGRVIPERRRPITRSMLRAMEKEKAKLENPELANNTEDTNTAAKEPQPLRKRRTRKR